MHQKTKINFLEHYETQDTSLGIIQSSVINTLTGLHCSPRFQFPPYGPVSLHCLKANAHVMTAMVIAYHIYLPVVGLFSRWSLFLVVFHFDNLSIHVVHKYIWQFQHIFHLCVYRDEHLIQVLQYQIFSALKPKLDKENGQMFVFMLYYFSPSDINILRGNFFPYIEVNLTYRYMLHCTCTSRIKDNHKIKEVSSIIYLNI